jgi:hypothetical protein
MTHFLSFCPGLPPRIKAGGKMGLISERPVETDELEK